MAEAAQVIAFIVHSRQLVVTRLTFFVVLGFLSSTPCLVGSWSNMSELAASAAAYVDVAASG